MRIIFLSFAIIICLFSKNLLKAEANIKSKQEMLIEEEKRIEEFCLQMAKFYEMPEDIDLLDITDIVLKSPYVRDVRKETIQNSNRRIYVFTYPSDGLQIKGVISFVPDPENHAVLVFLRGGNKIWGMPNPGSDILNMKNYTVIATTYRDGINAGHDEFGGNDLNDVKNLVDFIPELQQKLQISLSNTKYLMGESRGGMQMFLALARFPTLQQEFAKIVSLSGLLDMRYCLSSRPDMEQMFIDEFGLIKDVNEEEWINARDPLLTVDKIKADLPILILQGTNDIRVELQEGYHMVEKLEKAQKNVTYLEAEGGTHSLTNIKERIDIITDWLEQ